MNEFLKKLNDVEGHVLGMIAVITFVPAIIIVFAFCKVVLNFIPDHSKEYDIELKRIELQIEQCKQDKKWCDNEK